MQGTVWGGLKCKTTVDQLPKEVLNNEDLMYKYKGEVSIPPLEMVDDIITVAKCGNTSVRLNAIVNAFLEKKKLALKAKNCAKIHLSNKSSKITCPDLKVHKETGSLIKKNILVTSSQNSLIQRRQ